MSSTLFDKLAMLVLKGGQRVEQTTHRQMSESFRLGAVLALTGGFLDAYTYLIRGGVFANAQTGNIVLLGVRLMEGDWGGAGHYLVPILAFAAGVLAAELIRGRFRGAQALHWRQITVAAELLLLAAVAFLPAALDNAANVLVAFVCAVQVESFRKVNGNAFATTMCTGNLRSGSGPGGCTYGGRPASGTSDTGRPSTTALSCFSLSERRWGPGAAAGGGRGRCWGPACSFWRPFCLCFSANPLRERAKGYKIRTT